MVTETKELLNYSKDKSFRFQGIDFPKDDYVPNNSNDRVLSKFSIENRIVDDYEDSYTKIYNFILSNLIPKYNELVCCDIFHEDIEGNPSNEYRIKYGEDLSFTKRNDLHYKILEDINNFCVVSKFPSVFNNLTVLLIKM